MDYRQAAGLDAEMSDSPEFERTAATPPRAAGQKRDQHHLLRHVDDPHELRQLDPGDLEAVAKWLREDLIDLGARQGGHFAGSLGAVELAVAIDYVFDTPADRVAWDVGHQAYAHKALTGRRQLLRDIRRAHGPSGFLRAKRPSRSHDGRILGTGSYPAAMIPPSRKPQPHEARVG